MKEIKTKMKKELITRKVFTDEFATTYQYLTIYANELISNLELFSKVVSNESNCDDNVRWFAVFYIKNVGTKLREIPSVSDDEIRSDYKIYREFVISELKRLRPLIDMHYYSLLNGVDDMKRTLDRIDTYKLS